MPDLVTPHGGGALKPLMPAGESLAAARARARTLPAIRVSSREKGDLIMLGIGGFTPLEGFMTRADWEGVCDNFRTADGLFWPIPITLSVDAKTADSIRVGDDIALAGDDGRRSARGDEGLGEVLDRQGARVLVRVPRPRISSIPA